MAALPTMRPLGCLRTLFRAQDVIQPQMTRRFISTAYSKRPERVPLPPNLPQQFLSQLPVRMQPQNAARSASKPVKVYPAPPSTSKTCKDPVAKITESQLAVLDPKGERKALFDYRRNTRSVKPGDIVRVTFKNGDPFNGVVLSIKLRGIDTSFLLRNELTRVGVEMSVKVFSPNVQSVEIVQRAERKPRRARLYYMRSRKHDRRSVENLVASYVRQKRAFLGGKRQ
ncbi:Ribosomal protein L19 [Penicillium longicatenatum]|uniref:Ribosomal protein L19 n=1 Tax=Penicillium longicatenatum TaxID=1561947 RepID=UPI0025491211|nr:Ribosomal protein L19 [Penicillium longicatenatum]KAJ5649361.1 Ribosomal protein L19 [Penicillium longicatenatum]